MENEHIIITSNSNDMIKIKNTFEEKNIEIIESLITKIAKSVLKMDYSKSSTLFKLLEKLEENEDVQEVYSNFEVPDDIMEKLAK